VVLPGCVPEELHFQQRFVKESCTRSFRFVKEGKLVMIDNSILYHHLRADQEGIEGKERCGMVG